MFDSLRGLLREAFMLTAKDALNNMIVSGQIKMQAEVSEHLTRGR